MCVNYHRTVDLIVRHYVIQKALHSSEIIKGTEETELMFTIFQRAGSWFIRGQLVNLMFITELQLAIYKA